MRLPRKQSLQLKVKLQELQASPFPHNSKVLIGYSNYYRVSVGEYRIVYRVENNILLVPLIGKRNDDEVYKKLKQIL
ncbi:MAG: type II toxin-antitoxin system RelE/ParE family toxin [bacterium]